MRECRFPEILKSGACLVREATGKQTPACRATFRKKNERIERRFVSLVLSRPEHYFSLYQSGCNLRCLKCHSAVFSQMATGKWYDARSLADAAEQYAAHVNVEEPGPRWTMYHAEDLCRGCGACRLHERRSDLCPEAIPPENVLLSPQGYGPARNLVAFTGGDLTCRPEYYAEAASTIRERVPSLHVLVETNGVALDRQGLEILKEGGVEAFWLDIKAFDSDVHRSLTGIDNRNVLAAPALMKELGFTFEVLSLFIPRAVETEQIVRIAELVASVDEETPFTLLAFFPRHELAGARAPTFDEMMTAGEAARDAGLKNLRLGNLGVFCRTERQAAAALGYRLTET
jgi:pyruvate-formate lyase-activating enzyme